MIKRRLIRWSLILAILAAFAVLLEPTRVVWGWLRGDAFYDWRPTSWWERELARWDMEMEIGLGGRGGVMVYYERSGYELLDSLRSRLTGAERKKTTSVKGPALLRGDPQAQPVLCSLVEHPVESIRRLATHGLHMIGVMQTVP